MIQNVVPSGDTVDREIGVSGSVRSVERALDLLLALEKSGRPMGVSDLCRAVGIPKATAQRLLSVLERRGFARKEQKRYQLGSSVVSLAGAFLTEDSLCQVSLPILEDLAISSGETASLSVRQGYDRVVIQRVNSPHPLRYTIRIGQRLPLHLGAAGKVLSSGLPGEVLQQLLDRLSEIRLAKGEAVTKEELIRDLEQVRNLGFAVSREERVLGVISVAAPILTSSGETLAAISITGPLARINQEKIDLLSVTIRQASRKVAERYERI